MAKKILTGLLVIAILMQFIQPSKNQSASLSENDISKTYSMPVAVHNILVNKCYDCHSNNTHYPWYTNLQPIGWWMASHIHEGKEELDFSEFKTYSAKRAAHKLEEIAEEIAEGNMPIDSYLWIHSDAKVTPDELREINSWIASLGIRVKR